MSFKLPGFISKKSKGFSLVEIVLTSAIFVLIVSAFTGAYLYGNESSAISATRQQAVFLAEEAIEALQNIGDDDFANLTAGTHGLTISSNQWIFSGTSDSTGIFTRNLTITDTSATQKQATVNVAWQQTAQRTGMVTLTTNFTDWTREIIFNPSDFVVDISTAALANSNISVQGITVENTSETEAIIDFITITWDNVRQVEKVTVNGTDVWVFDGVGSPDGAQSSVAVLDIDDYIVTSAMGVIPLTEILFSGSMYDSMVTVLFTLANGETIEKVLDFTEDEPPPPPDWTAPNLTGIFNTSNSSDGNDVVVIGDTAYVVTDSSGNDFYVIDVSNHLAPTVTNSLSLGKGAERLDVENGKAYIASRENSQELQIVDIPGLFLEGTYNKPSNSNATDVAVSDYMTYLVTRNTSGYEFYSIYTYYYYWTYNTGGIDIGTNVRAIDISGNYAYIATDHNSKELQVVDVSSIWSPTVVATLDLPTNSNGFSVFVDGSKLYFGQTKTGGKGEFYIIDISTPTSPQILNPDGFEVDADINGIFVEGTQAFLATASGSAEFQVLNVATHSSPTLIGTLNLAGAATSVYVVDGTAFLTTKNRNQELIIVEPF